MKGPKIQEIFEILLHNVHYSSEHLPSEIELSHWSTCKTKQKSFENHAI